MTARVSVACDIPSLPCTHALSRSWHRRIVDLCKLALELGFLPHTNAGPLSYEEMAELGHVNASMGLMLEQVRKIPFSYLSSAALSLLPRTPSPPLRRTLVLVLLLSLLVVLGSPPPRC